LEEFIDQPFRTYSTGMQARLTFSVATCVDPDILIVDEALAVGDARFQLKSFDRMREFKRRGKAILLVSHSINQITAFCDYAILLDHGRMLADGDPNRVGNIYHELLFGRETRVSQLSDLGAPHTLDAAPACDPAVGAELSETGAVPEVPATDSATATSDSRGVRAVDVETEVDIASHLQPFELAGELTPSWEHRYGNGDARIIAVEIRDLQGRAQCRLRSLESYEILWVIRIYRPIPDFCWGFKIRDHRGLDIFATDSNNFSDLRFGPQLPDTTIRVKARFRTNLAGGQYFLTASLASGTQIKYDQRFDVIEFVVEPTSGLQDSSIVNLEARFETDGQDGDPDSKAQAMPWRGGAHAQDLAVE
jgi:lipopolysaccharide transport system ATP-binding protein